MIEQFRRWFQYEEEMVAKTLASLESVPEEGRSTSDFQRALSIMAHVLAARQIWLERFGETPKSNGAMFPSEASIQSLAEGWSKVAAIWKGYLDQLDDDRLKAVMEYKSIDAGSFRNSIEEILTQLFGHGWYHRGQIAMLVRSAGGTPAITDYIYWCRQPVD